MRLSKGLTPVMMNNLVTNLCRSVFGMNKKPTNGWNDFRRCYDEYILIHKIQFLVCVLFDLTMLARILYSEIQIRSRTP